MECYPVTGEITYGLERLAMNLQGVDSVYDLVWTKGQFGTVTYGDVFHQNEVEQSTYNFEHANVPKLFELFENQMTLTVIQIGQISLYVNEYLILSIFD